MSIIDQLVEAAARRDAVRRLAAEQAAAEAEAHAREEAKTLLAQQLRLWFGEEIVAACSFHYEAYAFAVLSYRYRQFRLRAWEDQSGIGYWQVCAHNWAAGDSFFASIEFGEREPTVDSVLVAIKDLYDNPRSAHAVSDEVALERELLNPA